MSNYVDRFVYQLSLVLDDCPIELLRLYALLGLIEGVNVSGRDVHDAWAVWCTTARPDHPNLLPFDLLTQDVKELDKPYADAIRYVAQKEQQ